MYKRRNPTENEISTVISNLYEYRTDFPGKIAQALYDLGYRRLETTAGSEDQREARNALTDYERSQPNDYERAYAEPLAEALRKLLPKN